MKKSILFLFLGLGFLMPTTDTWADECDPSAYPDYGFGAAEEVFFMRNAAPFPMFFRSNSKGLVIGCRPAMSLSPIAIPKSFFEVEVSGCSKYEANDSDCTKGQKIEIPASEANCYLIGAVVNGEYTYKYTKSVWPCPWGKKAYTASQKPQTTPQKRPNTTQNDKETTKK